MVVLFTSTYSHFVLNGNLVLRSNRLPPKHKNASDETMSESKKITRVSNAAVRVYCLPEERQQIGENAARAGMSVSSFLLAAGCGYKITGIVDYEQVRELARINGDLGRLGGLLKLWLTDDAKAAQIGAPVIAAMLKRIEKNQDDMAVVMRKIVRPKAGEN